MRVLLLSVVCVAVLHDAKAKKSVAAGKVRLLNTPATEDKWAADTHSEEFSKEYVSHEVPKVKEYPHDDGFNAQLKESATNSVWHNESDYVRDHPNKHESGAILASVVALFVAFA